MSFTEIPKTPQSIYQSQHLLRDGYVENFEEKHEFSTLDLFKTKINIYNINSSLICKIFYADLYRGHNRDEKEKI